MTTQKPERKDWVLLIFIIPIGVFLLLFVGQWAIRLLPFWSVNAGMNSNLEPDTGAVQPFGLLQPLLPQILIPLPWAETYLDPNGNFSFPPFLTFEPTASPAPTAVVATEATSTPTATLTETPVPTSTSVVGTSPTNSGGGGEETPTETATPPTTCTDPLANNQGQPLPCTYPPTTCTDPLANNQGQPLPCTFPPPTPVCPGAHNPNGPLPCDYGTVSTPPPSVILNPSPDTNIDVGGLPNNTDPNDDNNIGSIADGTYIYLSLSVTVSSTPDNNYDLVFYEWDNGGFVYMDLIIIGIAVDNTSGTYYEVFNWGDGTPDMNSNVGDVAGSETDDQATNLTELHDPDGGGTAPQTGILIDVDNADSDPPPGTYNYVIIISPLNGGVPDGGDAQVDAIQATEVPIP